MKDMDHKEECDHQYCKTTCAEWTFCMTDRENAKCEEAPKECRDRCSGCDKHTWGGDGMAGSKNAGEVIGVDGWNGIAMTGDKMGPAHTGDEAAAEVARVKATVDAAMTGMAGSKNAGKVIGVDGWNGIAMTGDKIGPAHTGDEAAAEVARVKATEKGVRPAPLGLNGLADGAADPAMTAAVVKEATEAAAIASNTAHKEVITAEDVAIQAKAKQLAAEENKPPKVLKSMQREPKLAAKNKIKKVHRHKTVGGRREPKHFGGD